MGLWDKFKSELIDIVEFLDNSDNTLSYRFERKDNEIKNGAKLTVRPGQIAVFVNEGKYADVFREGLYALATQNLPILSTLKGWKYGFDSPFKAEVYFLSTKHFNDQQWGTMAPITLDDPRYGMIEVKAFGTYGFQIVDPIKFHEKFVATDNHYTTEELKKNMMGSMGGYIMDVMGELGLTYDTFAKKNQETSAAVLAHLKKHYEKYGLDMLEFNIMGMNLTDQFKKEIAELSRLDKINMQKLAQYKTAQAIEKSAENPSGGAGMGMGFGMGMGMGNMMANQMGQMYQQPQNQQPQNFQSGGGAPPPLPGQVKFFIAINGQQHGPYEMPQMQQMIQAGQVTKEMMVWKEGMAAWAAAGSTPELGGMFGATPPPPPPPM